MWSGNQPSLPPDLPPSFPPGFAPSNPPNTAPSFVPGLPPNPPPSLPNWPPPDPRHLATRHRPFRAAYVFAIVLPLLLIALLAAPLGIALALRPAGQTATGGSRTGSTDGQPGVGDPYYPDAGSSGYDATKYQIAVDWDPVTETMTATTTISARALQPLSSFYFDLALQTDQVSVNGKDAAFEKRGFADVRVVPAEPIPADSDFDVVVHYSGAPGKITRGDVRAWWSSGKEWVVAGEPESAAWWFPSDDHPSDPALMDISVRVPTGLQVVSVGRLESKDTGQEAAFDTWHWVSRQPMATYLAFVAIGKYQLVEGVADQLPFVYAVSMQLSAADRAKALGQLEKSVTTVRVLEQMFGPYPFSELGGVVPANRFWFSGLETQTRPVYDPDSILNDRYAPILIAHELTHMWFGDNVTLRQWNDIFDNEAYASWAQWGFTERTGGDRANVALNRTYERTKNAAAFWQITMIDPGRNQLFTTVYTRGPMALQALRNLIGDKAFFSLARDWAQHPGSRSLEDWMTAAQTETTIDLGPFFQAWIFASVAPARTAENGFRD
jgi:aminopeptidase N